MANQIVNSIIFDFGDTLVHLDPPREVITQGVLRECGFSVSLETIENAYIAVDYVMKQGQRNRLDAGNRDVFFEEYHRALSHFLGITDHLAVFHSLQKTRFSQTKNWVLFDDVLTMLDELAGQYRLFLLANWDDSLKDQARQLNISGNFDAIWSSADLGVEKPAVEFFQKFLERSGLTADECVYVGNDYFLDIVGARAAGLTPVLLDRSRRYGDQIDCQKFSSARVMMDWLHSAY